jgi:hypothetical protein
MNNTDKINTRNIPKLPIEKAAALLVKKGVTKSAEFYKQYRDCKLPKIIPGDPKKFYKDEYQGWKSFIAMGKVYLESGKQIEEDLPSFVELKRVVKSQFISSRLAYVEAVKQGDLGDLAPLRPDILYGDDFKSWSFFLAKPGEGTFLPFVEARQKMQDIGIRNSVDWNKFCAKGKRPNDLPCQPSIYYVPDWKGWKNFTNKEKSAKN